MVFQIELEQDADGRWIAGVTDLADVLASWGTRNGGVAKLQALALGRNVADQGSAILGISR